MIYADIEQNYFHYWIIIIIIIIFYFENNAFFHAKLGWDVCPRVDNQTSGDTLQDLTQGWHFAGKNLFLPGQW